MIVLGIDTSGYINAVGICNGEKVLADASYSARTDSLEQIVDNIDSTLKNAGLTLNDVEGIGVGLGPGSWTGIKVGVTVGKMLAFSTEKPVACIPTLEALAYSARDKSPLFYAIVNAGVKDTIYAARYYVDGTRVVQDGDYFTGSVKDLAPLIKEPCLLVGSEIEYYRQAIIGENSSLSKTVRTLEANPSGAAIACLAALRLEQGESDDPLSLTPLYLKESTAKAFVNKYAPQAKGK